MHSVFGIASKRIITRLYLQKVAFILVLSYLHIFFIWPYICVILLNSFTAGANFCHLLITLQTVWTQIMHDKMLGLIWSQTV